MDSKHSMNSSLQHHFISDINSLLVLLMWDSKSNMDKTLYPQCGGRLDIGACAVNSIRIKINKK